jgi:hypothetical protein
MRAARTTPAERFQRDRDVTYPAQIARAAYADRANENGRIRGRLPLQRKLRQ